MKNLCWSRIVIACVQDTRPRHCVPLVSAQPGAAAASWLKLLTEELHHLIIHHVSAVTGIQSVSISLESSLLELSQGCAQVLCTAQVCLNYLCLICLTLERAQLPLALGSLCRNKSTPFSPTYRRHMAEAHLAMALNKGESRR